MRYAVFSQPDDEDDLGMADASMEDFFKEFAPEPVQVDMTSEGLRIVTSHAEAQRSAEVESASRQADGTEKDDAKLDLRSYGLELVLKVLEICKVLKPEFTVIHNTFAQKLFQSILGTGEISDDEAVLAQAGAEIEAKLIAAGSDVQVWERLGQAQRSGLMKDATATQVGKAVRRLVLHVFTTGHQDPEEDDARKGDEADVRRTEKQSRKHVAKSPATPRQMGFGQGMEMDLDDSDGSDVDDTSSEDEEAPRRQKPKPAPQPTAKASDATAERGPQQKRKVSGDARHKPVGELQQITPKGMQPLEAARIFFNPQPTLLRAARIETIPDSLAAHEIARFLRCVACWQCDAWMRWWAQRGEARTNQETRMSW